MNSALIHWYLKKEFTSKTSIFQAEFVAVMQGIDGGLSLLWPTYIYGDNLSVVDNTSMPESTKRRSVTPSVILHLGSLLHWKHNCMGITYLVLWQRWSMVKSTDTYSVISHMIFMKPKLVNQGNLNPKDIDWAWGTRTIWQQKLSYECNNDQWCSPLTKETSITCQNISREDRFWHLDSYWTWLVLLSQGL